MTENKIIVTKDFQNVTALKVIGIFNEKNDLEDELNTFKELAKHYSQYVDILFYLVIYYINSKLEVTSSVIAEQAYSEYGTFWFAEWEKSTIIIINRELETVKHDPTDNLLSLIDFIHL